MASSSLQSLVRPTANRAVHLRITPRPSNIGESREILRLISQFGEVDYFKNMKYDKLAAPNAAIVLYREEQAAQDLLKRSPVRFRMGKVGTPAQGQQTGEEARIFQIQTNTARAGLRDQINMGHFHGQFIVDGKSAAQQDLAKRVPVLGLSDVGWRKEDKPWKVMVTERERDGSFRGSGRRWSLGDIWEEGRGAATG